MCLSCNAAGHYGKAHGEAVCQTTKNCVKLMSLNVSLTRLKLVQAMHTHVLFLEPKTLNAATVQVQACCQLAVLLKLSICTVLMSTPFLKVAYVTLSTITLLLPYSSSLVLHFDS